MTRMTPHELKTASTFLAVVQPVLLLCTWVQHPDLIPDLYTRPGMFIVLVGALAATLSVSVAVRPAARRLAAVLVVALALALLAVAVHGLAVGPTPADRNAAVALAATFIVMVMNVWCTALLTRQPRCRRRFVRRAGRAW